jgi:hypothetical protein
MRRYKECMKEPWLTSVSLWRTEESRMLPRNYNTMTVRTGKEIGGIAMYSRCPRVLITDIFCSHPPISSDSTRQMESDQSDPAPSLHV